MSYIKKQIELDYNGFTDFDFDFPSMEEPVGDLFDDDTYWLSDEDMGEEE